MHQRFTTVVVAFVLAGCGGGQSFVVAGSDDASVDSAAEVDASVTDAASDVPADTSPETPVTTDPCAGKAEGTVCSSILTGFLCIEGSCVPTRCGDRFVDVAPGEECDDENDDPNDGCHLCRFGCHVDAECDDGDVCNGKESCDLAAHVCDHGDPLVCDDGKGCTKDTCDAKTGCANTPIDADGDGHTCDQDCDDGDPSVYVGAPELCDGKDNDCDGDKDEPPVVKATCYADADGDGYSIKDGSFEACTCPAGTTVNAPEPADCSDATKAAHPKQTEYFTVPFCASGISAACEKKSFDYDCSGAEERERTALHPAGGCGGLLSSCAAPGWKGSVPACGEEGTWVTCSKTLLGCKATEVKLRQGCH